MLTSNRNKITIQTIFSYTLPISLNLCSILKLLSFLLGTKTADLLQNWGSPQLLCTTVFPSVKWDTDSFTECQHLVLERTQYFQPEKTWEESLRYHPALTCSGTFSISLLLCFLKCEGQNFYFIRLFWGWNKYERFGS